MREILRSSGQPSSAQFLRHIETHARVLRAQAGVSALARMEPRSLTRQLGIVLASLDEIEGLSQPDRCLLGSVDPKTWSGVGLPLPDGSTLVILHPGQTEARATATIMEEVAHAHYGHSPSGFKALPGGMLVREYRPDVEKEAYWTAAAALLPSEAVARAVWWGSASETLAQDYGVSLELAEFRIKTLRLWSQFRSSVESG